MRPDFFVKPRHMAGIVQETFIPANTRALNWMLAHTSKEERGEISAHLDQARAAQFRSDAQLEGLTVSAISLRTTQLSEERK